MITNLLDPNFSHPSDDDNSSTKNSPADRQTTASKTDSWRKRTADYWKQVGLRQKATLFAVAISIVPIATVGGVAHQLAARSLTKQIITDQESRTFDVAQKVSLFTNHVISDANSIASSPLLADSQISAIATEKQKIALLNDFIEKHPLEEYDSIAVFDLDGNLQFQSQSSQSIDLQENYSNHDYFQRAIISKAAAVNDPEIHSTSNKNSLAVAAPIQDRETGEVLGVIHLQMSLNHWKEIFQYVRAEGWEYRLIDTEGYIFDADESEFIGDSVGTDLEDLPQLQAKLDTQQDRDSDAVLISTQVMRDLDDRKQVLATLAPISNVPGVLSPGWKIAISRPLDEAFAPLKQLRMTLLLGTSGAALLVAAIATLVANRAIVPILAAAYAVRKIGSGELDTQLKVRGTDEIAVLGTNINKMARKLRTYVRDRAAETERSRRLKDLTLKLSRADNSQQVFEIALREILLALKADRATIYHFENNKGKIVAESIVSKRSSSSPKKVINLEYLDRGIIDGKLNKVRVTSNIYQANLDIEHLRQLEAWNAKAELIAPFSTGKDCHDLLLVHQCGRERKWQQIEVDFFTQLTSQMALAWSRANLLQQQLTARKELQRQALGLLTEVEPISKGDLTTRATVTEGEIGTIADSYNSTVESLREIVIQVQKSTTQMTTAASNNEGFVQSLSQRASEQSMAVADALKQIKAMTESVQAVATNTEEVEATFQEVLQTVATGDAAMDRTVAGILNIRETVAQTATKVKRLGESSQKISKVVNLIDGFASQTNLLALNASLEASRAGEEEHNFAIVAEEIRNLAQQSAEATTEIEKIVASIQLDTKEVFKAMEEGVERVVIGTQLVDETRQSLNQVALSSQQVNNRIAKIAQETVEESQASQKITQTIARVAAMADTTSTDAQQVSVSTQKLLEVAEALQTSVSRFKA